MSESFDIIIIGGGIAGTSAALTAMNRGKRTAVIANPMESESLYKAEKITNYPGLAGLSGRELSELLRHQLEGSGAKLIRGRALNVMDMGGCFGVAVGNDFYEAKAVILALGITREKLYPGEAEFLGRGVSYCATCDAHFYPGKTVAVLGYNAESCREANFLAETAGRLLYFPVVPHEVAVNDHVQVINERPIAILGQTHAEGVQTEQNTYAVDGVFVLRDAVAPDKLVPGLAVEGAHVRVDANMATNLSGCFACGDLAGKPYQYIKAAGQGNVAALSAVEWLAKQKK